MVLADNAYPGHGDLAHAQEAALEVVLEALQWHLTEARWETIDQSLIAMDAALKGGDPAALTEATADLERAGPVRIIKIGDPQIEPPPPVRDRLNRLVHSLGTARASQRSQDQAASTDADKRPPES